MAHGEVGASAVEVLTTAVAETALDALSESAQLRHQLAVARADLAQLASMATRSASNETELTGRVSVGLVLLNEAISRARKGEAVLPELLSAAAALKGQLVES